MDNSLSEADIKQQYYGNVVMFKNVPVYISNVYKDKIVDVFYLESSKTEKVAFDRDLFKANAGRLGNVNIGGFVFYMQRVPSRMMQIGYNSRNTSITKLERKHPSGYIDVIEQLRSLKRRELFFTIKGKYPPFKKCMDFINKNPTGSLAFDRQFSVSEGGDVYYKTSKVGCVPLTATSVKEIVFNTGFEYLELLLENNYEKTIRTTCS